MWRHAGTNDNIDIQCVQPQCVFCKTKMVIEQIDNSWPLDKALLTREHESRIEASIEQGCYEFAAQRQIISDFYVEAVKFHCCPACGWWCAIQEIQYDTPGMPYEAYQWAAGALIKQEFPEIAAPISEVRSYLCARYDQRFQIDPYRLEDVVASIFRSSGCEVELTSRSNDGGLDVFGLDRGGQAFGVQVKRYRERIEIEQLRAFVGALVLNGLPSGVFVTTSDFTAGASKLRKKAKTTGIQLECADANKLFEMVKAAQIEDFDQESVKSLALTYSRGIAKLNYGSGWHMNSL